MQLHDKGRALHHFLELARRGRGRGASGGERRAARLAAAALENVAGMDDQAVEGYADFCRIGASAWQTAKELVDGVK